ncbi:MAG: hypothetical protein HW394_354 [Acidobacteria bacterium]|nr:hypothetical protein [Acidobacteriota bacterium]
MKLSEEVAGLSQHVDGFGQRVDTLDQRIDRFEARVDERFEAVDKRFDGVDKRFDRVDLRLDELRLRFDVIAEASRDDFRNLYDLFQAHMQRMEARTDTLAVTLRAEMTLGYDALDSRVTLLEREDQPGRRRTHR